MYSYVCFRTGVNLIIHIYSYISIHSFIQYAHTHTCMHTPVHTDPRTCTHTHSHTHANMHAHTHACTDAHTILEGQCSYIKAHSNLQLYTSNEPYTTYCKVVYI